MQNKAKTDVKTMQNNLQKPAFLTKTEMGEFYLFPHLCKGCGLCIVKCPRRTLGWNDSLGIYGTPAVEPGKGSGSEPCNACGLCEIYCPDCAIKIIKTK